MDIALQILGLIALAAAIWLIITIIRTLQRTEVFLDDADSTLKEIKKDINQMTGEVAVLRLHAVPVLDNIAEITQRVSGITEGLAPRIEAIYDTVDDTLDVV